MVVTVCVLVKLVKTPLDHLRCSRLICLQLQLWPDLPQCTCPASNLQTFQASIDRQSTKKKGIIMIHKLMEEEKEQQFHLP